MKILSIKISNILSFKHEDMKNCQEIKFDEDLNLLIGPNGAGKSNFIEILNQIFKKGIVSTCELNTDIAKNYDKNPSQYNLNNMIAVRQISHTLEKNHDSTSDEQEIELKIRLNKNDYENIFFILDHVTEINELLSTYTSEHTLFNSSTTKKDIEEISEITFYLKSNSIQKVFSHRTDVNTIAGEFIQNYFYLFQIIQYLIVIAKHRENKKWKALKNTFALIGSYRNYNSIESTFDLVQPKLDRLKDITTRITSDETRISKNEEPIIFEYIKNKLSFRLNRIEWELSHGLLPNPHNHDAMNFLKQENEFRTLNDLLRDYLEISLEIIHEDETLKYDFKFVDVNNEKRTVLLNDLSAGEKGIIHFIFSIYGFDLESGVMVIDEPEIHLHPQIQEKYLNIIRDTIVNINLQFIIATHSPIFINEKTIDHVYRFYKNKDHFTQTKKCSTITPDMRSRIQMLTYTNSALVFFAEQVVLTEGYGDYIYFKKYLNSYSNRHQKDVSKISILQMDGAGEYEKWVKLLQEFNIITSYIGDTDNLKNPYISHQSAKWQTTFPSKMLQYEILNVKRNNNTEYTDMVNEIKSLLKRKIFLLTEGSFEDYFTNLTSISSTTKKITNFCTTDQFDTWYVSNYFKKYAQEFESIMFHIINQPQ